MADFALQNMVETMLHDGLETSGRKNKTNKQTNKRFITGHIALQWDKVKQNLTNTI